MHDVSLQEASTIEQAMLPLMGTEDVRLKMPTNLPLNQRALDPYTRYDYIPPASKKEDQWTGEETIVSDQDTLYAIIVAVLFFMCQLPETKQVLAYWVGRIGWSGLMVDNEYTNTGLMVISAGFGGLFWLVRNFVL